ncbi:MAG: Peptidase family domain, partial [Deltaproteobacteria bacterium]|nr:Peptidase family domain [Deltaproteobacteria bacterium]
KIEVEGNSRFFKSLFQWLGQNSPHRRALSAEHPARVFPGITLHKGWDYETAAHPGSNPDWDVDGSDFIWPELEIRRNKIVFQYTRALEPQIEFLLKAYPEVYNTLESMFQLSPKETLYIQALPSAGSGYHWEKQRVVAIGCLIEPGSVIAIMAHELVHAWGLPTPRNFAHGWTTFTDDYIAHALKLFPSAEIERRWQSELDKVKEVDPGLNQLDITSQARDPREQRLLDKKVGLILKELHKRFGMETFAKFLRICREHAAISAKANPDDPTMSLGSFVFYFSQAANVDLVPFFRKYGTTVQADPGIEKRESLLWR